MLLQRVLASALTGLVVLGMYGCSSGTTATQSNEAAPPATTTQDTTSEHRAPVKALNNPAQQPNPSVTALCDEVPHGHACRAVTTSPSDPNESRQRNCNTDIVANSNTSCGFAENAFYQYYEAHSRGGKGVSVMVHSPATGKDYELFCEQSSGLIGCDSSPLSDDIYVSFPEAAIASYSDAQAASYARTHAVGHPGLAAASTQPQESSLGAREGGKSSGEDEVGSYSHEGDEAFCNMHECIGNFDSEDGYVVECSDGTFSHAGGISGGMFRPREARGSLPPRPVWCGPQRPDSRSNRVFSLLNRSSARRQSPVFTDTLASMTKDSFRAFRRPRPETGYRHLTATR